MSTVSARTGASDAGEDVAMPSRNGDRLGLELAAFDAKRQEAVLDVHCSTGTYVRALARDLGEAVGAGAHCAALRRTTVGPFDVADAAGPDEARVDPVRGAAPARAGRGRCRTCRRCGSTRRAAATCCTAAPSRSRPATAPSSCSTASGALLAVATCEGGVARPDAVLAGNA